MGSLEGILEKAKSKGSVTHGVSRGYGLLGVGVRITDGSRVRRLEHACTMLMGGWGRLKNAHRGRPGEGGVRTTAATTHGATNEESVDGMGLVGFGRGGIF